MLAKYRKLDSGVWGIRVETDVTPRAGDVITVRTAAGREKTETVDRVIWSGDGAHLCTIAARDTPRSPAGASRSPAGASRSPAGASRSPAGASRSRARRTQGTDPIAPGVYDPPADERPRGRVACPSCECMALTGTFCEAVGFYH